MASLKQFQSLTVAFMSEMGAALIFFASVFWIKPKNEVGFGAKPQYLGRY